MLGQADQLTKYCGHLLMSWATAEAKETVRGGWTGTNLGGALLEGRSCETMSPGLSGPASCLDGGPISWHGNESRSHKSFLMVDFLHYWGLRV